eukprot:gene26055-11755_t
MSPVHECANWIHVPLNVPMFLSGLKAFAGVIPGDLLFGCLVKRIASMENNDVSKPECDAPPAGTAIGQVADAPPASKVAEGTASGQVAEAPAASEVAAGTVPAAFAPGNAMSKSQQKKILKMEKLAAKKAYRKEQEKIVKKEAAEKRKQDMAAKLESLGEEEIAELKRGIRPDPRAPSLKPPNPQEEGNLPTQLPTPNLTPNPQTQQISHPNSQEEANLRIQEEANLRIQATREKKRRRTECMGTGPKLVLDLDFEGLMVDTDVKSLCQQMKFAYADNLKMERPCHLIFTSFTGVVKTTASSIVTGIENWAATTTDKNYLDYFAEEKDKIVYLTADSENELDELDESKIYIIGGLVDHNIHKGLCLKRADAAGIATARLPIQKYVQLTSRAVLTVNQVVQMMAEYFNKKDWQTVIDLCMPSRKRADKGAGKQDPAVAKKSDDVVVVDDMVDENPVVADETPVVTEKSGDAIVEKP